MEISHDYRIENVAQLRALIGEPNPLTPKKVQHALDDTAIEFIRRSPFIVLATADSDGNQDCSPKGDAPASLRSRTRRRCSFPNARATA